jgi:histidine triad (HIT) family protein
MPDSIFTKIIKGEIPCHKVYEDESTLAFLDIHPSVPGHTLVIPKAQVEFLWDLSQDDYAAVMATVKKLGAHLRERLGVPYVGVKVIGVDVPHTHVHLIPFTTTDGFRAEGDQSAEPDHAALEQMAARLKF